MTNEKFHPNVAGFPGVQYTEYMKKNHDEDFHAVSIMNTVSLLRGGIVAAKSTDSVEVALAMEGMKFASLAGEVEMRESDHQIQQPLFVSTWTKVNGKDVKYAQEKPIYGWKTNQKIDTYVASQPTSCDMKRPAR
ncbi:MAG: ABC transporter substrate-binding protein [Sulfuricaulis sp.]|nr:ABC transporter substrate-binding protein [Sulfuricaulis sp.]